MNDSSRGDSEKLESLCEELFEEIKAIVRQGTDQHPAAIYSGLTRPIGRPDYFSSPIAPNTAVASAGTSKSW